MATSERMSLWVAIVSVVGVTLSSVVNGAFQHNSSRAQILKDVHVAQLQSVEQREKLVREKYEALSVELSDFASFLDANNSFPVAEAKTRIAKCRRAAFALSAYADPALSLAAMVSVEAINRSLVLATPEEAKHAQKQIAKASSQLAEEFRKEIEALYVKRLELMRYSLGDG